MEHEISNYITKKITALKAKKALDEYMSIMFLTADPILSFERATALANITAKTISDTMTQVIQKHYEDVKPDIVKYVVDLIVRTHDDRSDRKRGD